MAFVTQSQSVDFREAAGRDEFSLSELISGTSETSQSTLLLRKRKEMREVDDALEFMKQEFKRRMEICDERQKEFEAKQAEMKSQVIRFEKFIQENDAKRHRAEAKIKAEREAKEQNEQKIQSLKSSLASMKNNRSDLTKELTKLERYMRYLEAIVESSESQYDEITEVLNRYTTLTGANSDLKALVDQGEAENDGMRNKLQSLQREMQNVVLVNNSEIHGNQKQLESLRADVLKSETLRERADNYKKDRQRETGQVMSAIRNLYQRCENISRAKTKVINEKETLSLEVLNKCLKMIQFRVNDLIGITESYYYNRDNRNNNYLDIHEHTISSSDNTLSSDKRDLKK